MTALIVLISLAFVWFIGAALYGAAQAARRYIGRHAPDRDTATLTDLMKGH